MAYPLCVCRLCRELAGRQIDRALCSPDCDPCRVGYRSPGCTGRCTRRDTQRGPFPDNGKRGMSWESKINQNLDSVGVQVGGAPSRWVVGRDYSLKSPRLSADPRRRRVYGLAGR